MAEAATTWFSGQRFGASQVQADRSARRSRDVSGHRADYETTFRVLRSLPCDVFLGAHGSFYSLVDKRGVMEKKPAQNPFIDPWGYQAYILKAEAVFQKELAAERDPSSAAAPSTAK